MLDLYYFSVALFAAALPLSTLIVCVTVYRIAKLYYPKKLVKLESKPISFLAVSDDDGPAGIMGDPPLKPNPGAPALVVVAVEPALKRALEPVQEELVAAPKKDRRKKETD